MERRQFVKSLLAAGLIAPRVQAQSAPDWGGPVLDTHLHLRKDADSCLTHMQGCGVTHVILLTPATDQDRAKQEMERRPGRFARSVRTDPTVAGADQVLRDALKGGAVSIGDAHSNVPAFPRREALQHRLPRVRQGSSSLSEDDVHRTWRPLLGAHQRRCSHRSRLSCRADQAGWSYR